MPTANVELNDDYKLIVDTAVSSSFSATNSGNKMQEWLWSDALPASSLAGAPIASGMGMNDSHGTGKLYGRRGGTVVVFT